MGENTNMKVNESKKEILIVILMILLGSIFTVFYLMANGNANQVYNDIIVEFTSMFSSNKSAERNLIFILCFLGILLYTCAYLISYKSSDGLKAECLFENQKSKEFVCFLITLEMGYLIVFGGTYQIIAISLAFTLMLYVIDKDIVLEGICVYFLSVYTYIAIYRMYVYGGGKEAGNNMLAAIIAVVIAVLPLFFKDKKKAYLRLSLLEGILIPFALLIYFSDIYKYGEKFVVIDVSVTIKVAVLAIIASFSLGNLILAVRKWNTVTDIEETITIGACATIMAFNRFDGTGAIMSTDLHHPFENIIGYSQVVELGRVPFKDYIPVSGMYSIVQGAIFEWFGSGGTFANYHVTNNFLYLVVIIFIVWILKKNIDNVYVLMISLFVFIQSYNRLVFMLPIMLLLIWPKLVEKKNLWLMTWFLTSLFQGLYYPLYGAATCIAFMPLVVWQVVTYVKSGEYRQDLKKAQFWFGWSLCLCLTILCMRFLLGTLRHMLAMSAQSILADGISRFGQPVPVWFFSYLGGKYQFVRLAFYYIGTFVVPALFVWVAYMIVINRSGFRIEGRRLKIENKKNFCVLISVVIMPIICYTFTTTRLDIDNIYARSTYVLNTGLVLLLVFVWKYYKNGILRLFIVFFAVSITASVNCVGIFATDSYYKLQAYYSVPENYIYIDDSPVEKIGTGFINQDTYNIIIADYEKFENEDLDKSYYGDPGQFGLYYLLGIKGDGAMEIASTVKCFSAAQESVDIVRENHSIIGANLSSLNNYYFYHWLLASGEYYWNAEKRQFMPNDELYTKEEIIEQNKNNGIVSGNLDVGKTASSWGLSMESLEELFSEKNVNYTIQKKGISDEIYLEESIDGDDADFLYIEFEGMATNYRYTQYNYNGEIEQQGGLFSKYLMKKDYNPGMTVQIWWKDENNEDHALVCKMSQGKLLLPLGAATKWLFNEHSFITVKVFQDDMEIDTPEIVELRFLKLQEVQ